jgi:hypothetical protein
MDAEDPGVLGELYVVAYDDDGKQVWGPETAEQVVYSAPLDWSTPVTVPLAEAPQLSMGAEGESMIIRPSSSRQLVGANK